MRATSAFKRPFISFTECVRLFSAHSTWFSKQKGGGYPCAGATPGALRNMVAAMRACFLKKTWRSAGKSEKKTQKLDFFCYKFSFYFFFHRPIRLCHISVKTRFFRNNLEIRVLPGLPSRKSKKSRARRALILPSPRGWRTRTLSFRTRSRFFLTRRVGTVCGAE